MYQNLIPQKDVWDVCCDHGYLGTAAYKSQNFANIYFVDRVKKPIDQLKTQFKKFVFKAESISQAQFICVDAQDIQKPVNGSISITGVGGFTIFEILEGLSASHFLNADRLILGPHRDDTKLIELIKNSATLKQYQLKSDIEVVENNRIRSILIFDQS